MAYENQIYKAPETGKYYSIVGGTAREFTDQEAAAKLAPNAQSLSWGANTAGWDPRHGGGTVGFGWSTADFTKQLDFQAQNAQLNQAAEQAAAKANAQAPAPNLAAPTEFQKYFQAELAKGRAAGDILSNSPFMAGGAQGPALQAPQPDTASLAGTQQPAPVAPAAPTASTYAGNSIVDYLKSVGKAFDPASRAKLAAEQGIANYKGTAEQNLQLLNKLRTASAPAPKPVGTITVDSFEKPTVIPTPAPTGNPQVDADAVVESVGKQGTSQIEQYLALLNPPQTEAQKQEQAILNRISGIVKDGTNRSADQAQAEKDAGIEQKTNDLNSVLGEIKMKEAEYNAYKLAQEGKPITMASITGSIAEKRNQIASEMLLLQAKADILQNNLASAQQRVDRAIDLKYDSLDQEYKVYQAQLEALQPTLNREEKQIATAQSLLLEERKQALQDKKDQEKSIQALVIEAAKNGASQSVLNQMSKATDFMSAIKIGGTYLAEQAKDELLTPTEAATLGVPYGTTRSQAAAQGIDVRNLKQELTPEDKMNTEIKLSNQVQKATEDSRNAISNISLMNTALQDAKTQIANGKDIGAASQAIITTFNKILDPSSVVRESEYARTPEGVSLLNKMQGYFTKIQSGGAGITLESLEDFVNTGKQFMSNYNNNQLNILKQSRTQAENYNLNLNNILDPNSLNLLSMDDAKQVQKLYQNATASDKQKIEKMKVEGINDYDIIGALTGRFNDDLSTSVNGSDIQKVADAIGQYETGGNYTKRGPVVTSGMYKGERALGKYQIMPGNLAAWSREALGRVVSEQEFMSNPKIQDQIAQYKMAQYLNKYGTVEDVASVWFSGKPLALAGNAKDVIGTTVPQYVKNVASIYKKLA